MLFNSIDFLFVFLPLTLLGWYLIKNVKARLLLLTIASFVFYAYWNWKFLGLMVLSIGIDYMCGQGIVRNNVSNRKIAKRWMVVSIVSNLSILGFFKYFNFFLDTFHAMSPAFFGRFDALNIILPVGISFYTFQSMSYSIDLYRNEAEKARTLLNFSAYVSMFPQLIAGPIVRYKEIAHQINHIQQKPDFDKIYLGLCYLAIGLFRKVVIADTFAKFADPFFDHFLFFDNQFIVSWFGLLAYALQIYFDFSAYSEMAIGLGLMMGFQLPLNFDSPYKASTFSDFWRRWHITLSSFLRDYLYIPLGGNRNGNFNTYKNLIITMLLGGLWHGASWLFVIWGALHGFYLAIERAVMGAKRKGTLNYRLIVFIGVCIAWIFFRANNLDIAFGILKGCFGMNGFESLSLTHTEYGLPVPDFTYYLPLKYVVFITAGVLFSFFAPNTNDLLAKKELHKKAWFAIPIFFLLTFSILQVFKESPFIYFQF